MCSLLSLCSLTGHVSYLRDIKVGEGKQATQRGGRGKRKDLSLRIQSLEDKIFNASFFSGSHPKMLENFFRDCLGSILIPKESHS